MVSRTKEEFFHAKLSDSRGNPVVTMHPKGTPAPASSVEAQVFEERVDLSNHMTGRQMIAVSGRQKTRPCRLREGSSIDSRGQDTQRGGRSCAERQKKPRGQGNGRGQAAAAAQNEAEESDATEEEATRESTTRRGRPRGGTKVAARIGERLRSEIGRGGRPRVGDG